MGSQSKAANPPAEAVREELGRILNSRTFARSQRQQRFLRHIVEKTIDGGTDSLKEQLLGIEVFDRGDEFNPRADNIVRVEARRLRQRLGEYYQAEGQDAPVVIECPSGAYIPQFSWRPEPGTPGAEASTDPPRTHRVRLWLTVAILVLVAGSGAVWYGFRRPASLAVLPFTDHSAGAVDQYLADGIAEDILQALAEIPRLQVVARTSSFRFRGQTVEASELGRRLGVAMLVEGSIHRTASRVRISIRLVNAGTGLQLWSGSEDADPGKLELAERALVNGMARALQMEPRRARPDHVAPAEAQNLLLEARYLSARGGDENHRRAEEKYRRALALDPLYGRAWAELARLLSLAAFHDYTEAPRLVPEVKTAARRAIDLDGASADASLALARVAWSYDWDWPAAELAWQKALDLNPSFGAARQSFALGLMSRRRFREAVDQSRRAIELDPLSFAASNDLGVILYAARRYREAAEHARHSLSLAPQSDYPRFLLGVALTAQGNHTESVAELESIARKLDRPPAVLGRLGYGYARAGRKSDAQAILQELMRNGDAARIYLAMVQTGLGDYDAALQSLEASAARRETDFLFIGADPIFDPLHGYARFGALCGRLGLTAR